MPLIAQDDKESVGVEKVFVADFKGHCAGCDAKHDSERFKSRLGGYGLPGVDQRMIDFPFESAANNRICNACYRRNLSRLNAKRGRTVEEEEPPEPPKQPRTRETEENEGKMSLVLVCNVLTWGFSYRTTCAFQRPLRSVWRSARQRSVQSPPSGIEFASSGRPDVCFPV